MKNYNKVFHSSKRVRSILGQQGMERPDELVHSRNHGLPMGESFLPFLVVVRIEDDIVPHAAVSHQVQILSQHGVPVLGYPQLLGRISRFVNARVSAGKRDELLVGGEPGDVGNLGEEVGSSNFADTGDGGEDFHLALMQGLLELHQGLGEIIVPLLAYEHCLGTVADHGGTITDPDGDAGEFLDFLDGHHVTLASFWHMQGLLQLFLSGGKHILGAAVDAQEFQ